MTKTDKKQVVSIFKPLCEKGFDHCSGFDEAKQCCVVAINDSNINNTLKSRMLMQMNVCTTIITLQKYIFNSYLKYSGLAVISRN